MQEVVIQLSKRKISILFFGTCCFVIFGFWLLRIAKIQSHYSSSYVIIISIIGIVFFSICGIYCLIKFFDRKPGLVINEEGIVDNSSAVGAGLVRWRNITNVRMTKLNKQKILTIEVNNANEIITNQTGVKRRIMYFNNKFYGSPIQISSNALRCNFQELYNSIKEQFAVHRII